ncbi:MAG: hypothetical protein IMZ64_13410 [Bacteroidetes bacterium]|nr:hypothetical protein [Bacteroidota bacterium]
MKIKSKVQKAKKLGKSLARTGKAMGKLAHAKTKKALTKADKVNSSIFRIKGKRKAGKHGWY